MEHFMNLPKKEQIAALRICRGLYELGVKNLNNYQNIYKHDNCQYEIFKSDIELDDECLFNKFKDIEIVDDFRNYVDTRNLCIVFKLPNDCQLYQVTYINDDESWGWDGDYEEWSYKLDRVKSRQEMITVYDII